MPLTIVTFADLGRKKNLKTVSILPVIEKFIAEKELQSLVCRINVGFHFRRTKGAISLFRHAIFKIISLIKGDAMWKRIREEQRVDSFAASQVGSFGDIVLFHPEYFFSKSLAVAKKKNITTIGISTMANPAYNAQLEREEFSKFGVDSASPYYYYKKLANEAKERPEFDFMLAFSESVRQSWSHFGFPENRIFVTQSDIDVDYFSALPKEQPEKFRVIYVANTNPLKGLHYLLDAWKQLKLKNAELLLVGNFVELPKEFLEYYDNIIDADATIKKVGHVAHDELRDLYRASSVFAFPSLSEGNPRTVMEAMAVGLPVITTKNAQSCVVDNETGFVVPIRDSHAFAEKLDFLYHNQDCVTQMGKRSQEHIKNRRSFGEQVFDAYQKIKILKNRT